MSQPFYLFYIVHLIRLWTIIKGYCPDPQGNQVAWWVVYQQKSLPFIHFYADSENIQDIKLQYPEKKESVLARAVNKIIQNEFDHYMVYSYDLPKAVKIALALPVPSSLKWSHGIIAMDSSLSKGIWILHNNLFFPAFHGSHFAEPGGDVWRDITIGDTTDNVFYVCISAEYPDRVNWHTMTEKKTAYAIECFLNCLAIGNKENIQSMLASILVGHPFVHHSNPSTLFENEVQMLEDKRTFYQSGRKNSLFEFSTDWNPKGGVYVYTKQKGTLMDNSEKSYCYTRERNSVQNFLGLAESNMKKAFDFAKMETIFAISDDPIAETYGICCFGQNVAPYAEIDTVMVCLKLPLLHNNLLRSSLVTTWICNNEDEKEIDIKLLITPNEN